MGIQLHLAGAKALVVLKASAVSAQEAVAVGKKPSPARIIPWAGFSGRGVRLRILSPGEKDDAEKCAAAEAGADAAPGVYPRLRARECLERCIVEVTREREVVDLGPAAWIKVSQQDLSGSGRSKLSVDDLFTAKDLDVLGAWFRENHDASTADLDAITGGAIETSDDDG